ncbi:dienelactone hydrolase family protein [Chryseolinea lacunae]|uniref:Dienelactone hydrolase family protein n=1 Tax=Chryseolinea lacunae TaxID=2801331 RepID=A0ABS1KJP1_9BACT|nr:dienelactone hydrolase family protein [Chryseolinea lacunae]MBL0739676.1 dienelactone hydrolase family protein [Chryseolinea lacunae]
MKTQIFGVLLVGLAMLGCSKDPLQQITPPDTNTPPDDTTATHPTTPDKGTHTPIPLGTNAAPYGYYVYTPENYASDTTTGKEFPVLIFLHASGENGNSQTSPSELDKILVSGPPLMIKSNTWSPPHPMVVVSPQCHEGWWDRDNLRIFIRFISETYSVDTTRIYLTGVSMGGNAAMDQLNSFEDNQIAAAVPIAGGGVMNDLFTQRISEVPVWMFHGQEDKTVLPDYSMALVLAVNDLDPPVHAKLTLYSGIGHDCGDMTYNGTGMGKENPSFDRFDMDIFTWMFKYTKPPTGH